MLIIKKKKDKDKGPHGISDTYGKLKGNLYIGNEGDPYEYYHGGKGQMALQT